MVRPKQTEARQTEARSEQSIDKVFDRIRQVLKEAYDKDPHMFIFDEDWGYGVARLDMAIEYDIKACQAYGERVFGYTRMTEIPQNHPNKDFIQTEALSEQSIKQVISRIRQVLKEAYPDKAPSAFINQNWSDGTAMIEVLIGYDLARLRKAFASWSYQDLKRIEQRVWPFWYTGREKVKV